MASPIQIILNHENFQQARDVGGGGPKKDFFAERDDAYRDHKRSLTGQLAALATALESQPQGDVGIVKVILRRDAWAKSHRPIRSLFKVDRIQLVGGGGERHAQANQWKYTLQREGAVDDPPGERALGSRWPQDDHPEDDQAEYRERWAAPPSEGGPAHIAFRRGRMRGQGNKFQLWR